MSPRFDSRTRRHMWVEFVVGSLLCSERFFFRLLLFSPFLKIARFKIPIRSWNARVFVNSWCSVNKQITFTFLLHLTNRFIAVLIFTHIAREFVKGIKKWLLSDSFWLAQFHRKMHVALFSWSILPVVLA